MYHNGSCIRSDFDKNKWNSTVDKFEMKLFDEGVPPLIISAALKYMTDNFGKFANGSGLSKSSVSNLVERERERERV